MRRYAAHDSDGALQRCCHRGDKVTFPTAGNADAAALELRALGCGPTDVYPCTDHWHLTKTPTPQPPQPEPTDADERTAAFARILLTYPVDKITRDALVRALSREGFSSPRSRWIRPYLTDLENMGAIKRCRGDNTILIADRSVLESWRP
jgi:hypothetical protein